VRTEAIRVIVPTGPLEVTETRSSPGSGVVWTRVMSLEPGGIHSKRYDFGTVPSGFRMRYSTTLASPGATKSGIVGVISTTGMGGFAGSSSALGQATTPRQATTARARFIAHPW